MLLERFAITMPPNSRKNYAKIIIIKDGSFFARIRPPYSRNGRFADADRRPPRAQPAGPCGHRRYGKPESPVAGYGRLHSQAVGSPVHHVRLSTGCGLPYPQPSRQELTTVPRRMPYSSGHIEYKHYGKYVERMIRRLADEKNPQVVSRTVDNLARYMRTKSYEYNQEHPNNEVIIKDIKNVRKCDPNRRSGSQ